MTRPLVPATEKRRLESLRSLHILDTPIEERFERITRLLCIMLDMPTATFTLVDEDRQWFKAAQGVKHVENPREISFCAHTIMEEDDVMLVPNARMDHRFAKNPLVLEAEKPIEFYAGCCVRAPDGERIGTLCVIDNRPRNLDHQQVQVLRDLASMVETELRNALLAHAQKELIDELDSAQRLALIDPMTRLWNRRGMTELLRREWAESIRQKKPLCLVVADIDHFKKINDTHGHQAGDEVIITVGKRLLSALRTEDTVARMGGEEFLLLLTDANPDSLPDTLERIRHTIEATPVKTEEGFIQVTASFGAIVVRDAAQAESEEMIKAADAALYRAKNAGRNRVEIG